AAAQRPDDIAPAQAARYTRILDEILLIVELDEAVVEDWPKRSQCPDAQHKANEDQDSSLARIAPLMCILGHAMIFRMLGGRARAFAWTSGSRLAIFGAVFDQESPSTLKILVAITGASGALYAQRLLDNIDPEAHDLHVVLSNYARVVVSE